MFKRAKALRLLVGTALSLGLVGFAAGCDDDFEDVFEDFEEWWEEDFHDDGCCGSDFGFDFWYF